jgi:Na+-translocating ferredoxin:NAD+ oxidoreductase RnfG subunit
VGDDVDGISGATITVRAATSAIRRSTRRMFREFVKEQLEAQK